MIVLGLDGLSWPLLRRLTRNGIMPRLNSLLKDAASGPMASTLPELSPVAWTTFYTASSPAEHGIYGFTDFEPGGYDIRLNSSGRIKSPAVWNWLSLRERKSVVLNVPLTYPARPLNGVMVSGFVALDYNRASYPAWVADFLRQSHYRLEADFERVHQDRAAFLNDLDQALAGRSMLLERFWPGDWDFFTLVVTDTDRLFHFFLGEYEDGGPVTAYFHDFFRRVDGIVGRVCDLAEELAAKDETPVSLILLSDHGFTPVKQEFHLNRWLASKGYLSQPGPEAKALALDPTRIYLNRPPKFTAGKVGAAEAGRLAGDISAALLSEPAVAAVTRGTDVYSGPLAGLAPDLIVRPAQGYEFKAKFTPGDIYTSSPLQGTHTFENAFYLIRDFGPAENVPPMADILDLGRLMFSRLGL